MRVVHLNTIIPGKLYQRGQFVTFPWSAKMQVLDKYDIGMVVNLWARPDPELHTRQGLIYIHWPIGGGEPPKNYHYMTDMIENYMRSGVKVLVHCEAGVNRSIWLVARLLAAYEQIDGSQALQRVSEAVGRVKVRQGLVTELAS